MKFDFLFFVGNGAYPFKGAEEGIFIEQEECRSAGSGPKFVEQ